jgi:RimJ/RimL family protein N-acetyltransferase
MRLRARLAKTNDLTMLFNWDKDALVRSMSFNQAPIDLETYKQEFRKTLSQQNSKLLIIEQQDESGKWIPIGQVHIDKDGEFTMSLTSEMRGQHLAQSVIKTGIGYIRRDPSIEKLIAHIKNNNIASVKSFEKAGFRLNGETTFSGHPCLEYIYKMPDRKLGLFY